MGGLLPNESPPRSFPVARNLTLRLEVHYRGAREVALMTDADSGPATSQEAPSRPLEAGGMRATVVKEVYHSVCGMLSLVRRRLTALYIEGGLPSPSCFRAMLAADVQHSIRGMLTAVRPRLGSLHIVARRSRARAMLSNPTVGVPLLGLILFDRLCSSRR